MALIDFQSTLGRLVQTAVQAAAPVNALSGVNLSSDEQASLAHLAQSAGVRLTASVQRSWCEGRAARSARWTLSVLPEPERRRLLESWVNAGGGTASFFGAEADGFLRFIAESLPERSYVRMLCQLEWATLRASEGAADFSPAALPSNALAGVLRPGRYAAQVCFYTDPSLLIAAFRGECPFPVISSHRTSMLFAPGIAGLCRIATDDEDALWQRLASTKPLKAVLEEGYLTETINRLLVSGAAEYAES